MDCKAFLQRLSEAAGPSGYERAIRELVAEEFRRYAHEVQMHKMGSVIALRRGEGQEPRRRIMLAGHMDEVALMVSKIEDGFLHVAQVGGLDPRILPGQEVIVHGRRELPGIIGARPPHVLAAEERDKVIPLHQLLVDVALPPDQVEQWVRVGDLVTFRRPFIPLQKDWVAGKSFDDRVGVVVVGECLSNLAERWKHNWDVYGVATCQEEVTFLGAITTTYGIRPDIGIAIDVTFGAMGDSGDGDTFQMGGGPAIGFGPNVHPKIYEMLVETAKKLEIPYQVEPLPRGSGTDAWAMQVSREGVPTGVIGVPLRYMHTPVETVCVADIERAGRLLAAFIAGLDESTMEQLTPRLDADG
ncbi:MAG: M42 family metallopeptidase [Chloroflexi bacterium]|nr:M42 family metallopeptidase [Chloroflexota bacterium]